MTACTCTERKRPLPTTIAKGSNERPRQWFVLRRNWSASAFNGYRREWSDSSVVNCRVCGRCWRTKAGYVAALPDCAFWPDLNAPVEKPWEEIK